MGLLIKADLETSAGSTENAYARIDTYRVDKVSSRVGFAITYWKNEKAAHKFNREYLEDKLKNATGLFANKVVLYNSDSPDGDEIDLPTFLRINLTRKEEVEIPIIENVQEERSIPYVSFNENGDEVTKYRTVVENVEKQVGTEVKVKEIIDNNLISDLPKLCYDYLKQEIIKALPGVEVIKV